MHRGPFLLALLAVPLACGGSKPEPTKPEPLAESCKVRFPPRANPLEAETVTEAPGRRPSSRLVANVELKLAAVQKELEAHVAPRLAEERNHGIGAGGHINYTADRGPFSVAVEGDALIVRTDVRAHAEACRGNSCYASCDPQGKATATVPLRLTPDYRFQPSHVTFAFSKPCEVRALFIKIDITPTIQAQLQPSLRKVEQEIDGKLPPMKPEAERLWSELNKSRNLPLGGCIVPSPAGLVEGPASGTPDALRVRFGLVAYPEVRTACGAAPPAVPLPPLAQDPGLPAEDDLVVALVSPIATTAAALEGSTPLDAGTARVRIAKTTATPAGAQARIDLGLAGEACGDLAVRTGFAWDDTKQLHPVSVALAKGEAERASGITADAFLKSLAAAKIAPPIAPDSLKDLIPTLASSMSDSSIDVSAKVSGVKTSDVVVRGDKVNATVLLRGSVDLKQK